MDSLPDRRREATRYCREHELKKQPRNRHLDEPHRLSCCHSSSLHAAFRRNLPLQTRRDTPQRCRHAGAERFLLDLLNVNMQKIPEILHRFPPADLPADQDTKPQPGYAGGL